MKMRVNPSFLSSKRFGSQWATKQFENDHGDGLQSLGDTAAFDYWHCASGARLELKSSRRALAGHYTFQYIHPDRFDVGIFLGYRPDSTPYYWVIPSRELLAFLSKQHRGGNSYQMRVSAAGIARLARFISEPEHVSSTLSRACRLAVRGRKRVFLAPAFESIDGWLALASRLERRLTREFDSRWQIHISVAPPSGDELVPYPSFTPREFRMEFFAHPKPIMASHDVTYTVCSILDFLFAYEFADDSSDLLGNESPR